MKIDLEQFKDCDHCFHTFGSFGCCDTVNNELVFSCREGQKEYLIDRILEIIDKYAWYDKFPSFLAMEMAQVIKDEVKALKGE